MELQLKPHQQNLYPKAGLLIAGSAIKSWLFELQALGLSLENITCFPIPDAIPNSLWGCLVIIPEQHFPIDIRQHQIIYQAFNKVYIPEKSTVFPSLTEEDACFLFSRMSVLIHPYLGFIELSVPINWIEIVQTPDLWQTEPITPANSLTSPSRIKTLLLNPSESPDEIISRLETQPTPEKPLLDKPLNIFEKALLLFYKIIISIASNILLSFKATSASDNAKQLLRKTKEDSLLSKMLDHFNSLENRNQKYLDKLFDLLAQNPLEALKYAIPIDDGTHRGSENNGSLGFSKYRDSLSLFGNNTHAHGGGSLNIDDSSIERLRRQYRATAEQLIREEKYTEAAFVYLKLLKEYYLATQTLEKGEKYQEAASIYIKYLKNYHQAAICYEKANLIHKAIEYYIKTEQYEKVGDLYTKLEKHDEAILYYQKVADNYHTSGQFVKASLVYKNKMYMFNRAQAILWEGWEKNQDAFNCLGLYFGNIPDDTLCWQKLQQVSASLTNKQYHSFLDLLKNVFKNRLELQPNIKELAYEIISTQLKNDSSISTYLAFFVPNDPLLIKDTIRFRLNYRF